MALVHTSSVFTITNCIVWNTGDGISTSGVTTITVEYSDIQEGWPGTGNIDADPMFVDPDNGDLRLLPGSPCLDAGDNTAVPKGIDTDLDGNPRFVGNGTPPVVDMGAYESQDPQIPPVPCVADIDLDGLVGVPDLLLVLAQWGSCPAACFADINGDGSVNVPDLLTMLAAWGPCQ